jgi:DNA-binding NarL/FixJ family response regulator
VKRYTVLVGDVDPTDLAWIETLLAAEFEIIGLERDGKALVVAAVEKRPDAVVLPISMRSISGVEVARRIRTAVPQIRIIFFTVHSESLFKLEAQRAGASAYVSKHAPERLVGAIYAALARDTRDMEIVDEGSRTAVSGIAPLTQRQRDVLQLVSQGHALKEIAAALDISPKTVEFHKYRLMARLGVRSTAELIAAVLRHDLASR